MSKLGRPEWYNLNTLGWAFSILDHLSAEMKIEFGRRLMEPVVEAEKDSNAETSKQIFMIDQVAELIKGKMKELEDEENGQGPEDEDQDQTK